MATNLEELRNLSREDQSFTVGALNRDDLEQLSAELNLEYASMKQLSGDDLRADVLEALEKYGPAPTPMTDSQQLALDELRGAGFAVIIWNPSELKGVNPRHVEARSVELGQEMIDELKD